MAQANLGSRRACEEIIKQGRVRVNGETIHVGDQADAYTDVIEVDGEKLAFPDRKMYFAFNKPKNVLSTDDPNYEDWRRTVRSYIPYDGHLFNIGRLDADSEGLMVLTNDGDLANHLSHPRYHHTKTYKVVVNGLPSEAAVQQWMNGVTIEEDDGTLYKTAPCFVKITDGDKSETTLRVVMTEGHKRQIRRVAAQLGHPVKSLVRTYIGKLPLGALRVGEWRELTPKDLVLLKTSSDEVPRRSSRRPSRPQNTSSRTSKPDRKPQSDTRKRTTRREK